LSTFIAFALTLGVVIIIHELGHFAVCKWTGIYVKTFSIGFGPKLLRRRFGETEYALSIVPFGGYVKMAGEGVMEEIQDTGTGEEKHFPLGTEEGDLEAAEGDRGIPGSRHFRSRPAWQRLAVVVAGPLANLVLAFLIYSLTLFFQGVMEIPVTRVGGIDADGPAATAGLLVGDRILTVAGEPVAVWEDVSAGLAGPSVEAGEPVAVTLQIDRDGAEFDLELTPRMRESRWNLGLQPWDTEVGLVQDGGPADEMGLRSGDRIIAINDEPVTSFTAIAGIINRNADREVTITWERGVETITGTVIPEAAEVLPDSTIGRIFFDRAYSSTGIGLPRALAVGAMRTWLTIKATVEVLSSFVAGRLGLDAVGGPIRIGQVAGEMLRWSFSHLLLFIAFFSVNLFLLNLLPIPVLDGGHVVFLMIEIVSRRRVHERIQAIAMQVGLIVLMLFMTFVIVVDVLKLLPPRS